MIVSRVPTLLRGLLDDAAVFPPGNASLVEAVTAHRRHRAAWYADLIGPLLAPAEGAAELARIVADDDDLLEIGLVGDAAALPGALAVLTGRVRVRQLESPVAKRGQDPLPGLAAFLDLVATTGLTGYAEVPLTWGLLGALDAIAQARADGVAVAPKFRTGGLAAELFPTPVELAAVICACRDRSLPFKLTAGLHWAIRHTDPETGLVHHGFLNVLVASALAADGTEAADLAATLASVDSLPIVEGTRARLRGERPLWIGYGSCSIDEPLADLATLGLLRGPAQTSPG